MGFGLRIIGGAATLAAFMLFRSNAGLANQRIEETNNNFDARTGLDLNLQRSTAFDGNGPLTDIPYSGPFDPRFWDFIRQPLVMVQNYASVIGQNLIPLGLAGIGLSAAFNRNLLGDVFTGMRWLFGTAGPPLGGILAGIFRGLRYVLGPVGRALNPARIAAAMATPAGAGAVVALGGFGVWFLATLNGEFTRQNQENVFPSGGPENP